MECAELESTLFVSKNDKHFTDCWKIHRVMKKSFCYCSIEQRRNELM